MSKGPQQLPLREEVPVELTWDLTTIFKNDEEFEQAFNKLQAELPEVEAFKGTLNQGPKVFLKALEAIFTISRQLELLYVYSHLKNDQDTANTTYQGLYGRAGALYAQVSEAVSWFEPELLTLSDEEILAYLDEEELG